jgi:putative DNA primase/helicase
MTEPTPKPAHLRIVSAIDRAEPLAGPEAPDTSAPEGDDGQPSHMGQAPPTLPPGIDAGERDRLLALWSLTDLANAERFVARFGEDFRFVPEWGWLAWDGQRWDKTNAEAMVARAVHETVYAIKREADAIRDTGDDWVADKKKGLMWSDKVAAWCLTSQGAAHVRCIAQLAQPYLTVLPALFDADPMALNVNNGTLRFARSAEGDSVSLHAHARADLITKLAPVDFDPEAACPAYDAFLDYAQPDPAVRRHLHAYGGVSLTGIVLQMLAFWYGRGRNGKTTCENAWAFVMGDYANTVPIETFLDQGRQSRGGDATPDRATLPGVRFLRTSEPERGSKLAESFIKTVTGDQPMKARHLNRDFFEFVPVFKLVVAGNYKPRIEGTDEGIWRRMLLVPWPVTIPKELVDDELAVKLRAEASGILNRLLDGLRDYLDHGLPPAEAVAEATREFREESDPLGQFLAACVRPKPGARIQASVLHKVFVAWGKVNGVNEWSQAGLGRAMRERGFVSKQSNFIMWLDVELIKHEGDFVDFNGNPRTQGGGEDG